MSCKTRSTEVAPSSRLSRGLAMNWMLLLDQLHDQEELFPFLFGRSRRQNYTNYKRAIAMGACSEERSTCRFCSRSSDDGFFRRQGFTLLKLRHATLIISFLIIIRMISLAQSIKFAGSDDT